MKTVVIEVLGGVVQDVYAEEGTRIVIVDWDESNENGADECAGEIKPHPLRAMPEAAEKFIASMP